MHTYTRTNKNKNRAFSNDHLFLAAVMRGGHNVLDGDAFLITSYLLFSAIINNGSMIYTACMHR